MVGVLKEDGTREKNLYVSLTNDWNKNYEILMGGSSDKRTFEQEVAKFDKALETVVWKSE